MSATARMYTAAQLERKRERDRRRRASEPPLPLLHKPKPQPTKSEKRLREQAVHAAHREEFERAIRAVVLKALKAGTLGRTSPWFGMLPEEVAAAPLPVDGRSRWRPAEARSPAPARSC